MDMAVDSQVRGKVPELIHAFGRQSACHMLKNNVIKFVHQNTQLMLICEGCHELWIIEHLELRSIRVQAYASSRDTCGRVFMDASAESGKERLLLEQSKSVFIEIESFSCHGDLCLGDVRNITR